MVTLARRASATARATALSADGTSAVLKLAVGPLSVGHAKGAIGFAGEATSDRTYRFRSASRVAGALSTERLAPNRCNSVTETESIWLRPSRSRVAASTRPRDALPQTSVVAPSAATVETLRMTVRLRR